MNDSRINPQKVTKPIQLLAAWLVGLVAVDSLFLTAARFVSSPAWIAPTLAIAAIINVPLFLLCIFFLQTKFRPEMQEDTFYSSYLEKQLTATKPQNVLPELAALRTEVFNSSSNTLEIIQRLGDQVTTLARTLDTNERKAGGATDISVAEVATNTLRDTLNSAKRVAHWSRYHISVNKDLDSYLKIGLALEKHDIPINDTFGTGEELRHFLLSIGKDIDVADVQFLMKLLLPFGLDSIEYDASDIYRARLYIGSYAYQVRHAALLGNSLTQTLLTPDLTTDEFVQFIVANSKKLT
jgi:hypothetical protein